MSRLTRRIAFTALAAWLIGCGPAVAASQWDGWYGGVAAGIGKVDLTTSAWNDGTLSGIQLDNQGLALKAVFGYHFTPHLGVEISYAHFKDSKFSGFESSNSSTLWQPGPVSGEARAKGVGLEGVLEWPFLKKRFGLFAKGGWFFWDTTMISRPTVAGGTLALGDEQYVHDDGVSWLYGIGAEMRFKGRWHVRLEWEHTTVAFAGAFADSQDLDVDYPTLGVTLDF
jgi:opacity protein-like surface antigen